MPKASDFSKRLKASHLGGKPRELTIGQVGVEKMQKRNKQDIVIFAGEGMESPTEIKTEQVVYLWFRELGATRSMRVNESNLDILIKARGDDFKAWVNTKVVLTPEELFAFGKTQGTIVITDVKAPATPKTAPKVAPTETPNKETGELAQTSTTFWALADQKKMKHEASAILAKHTTNGITGKTTDWNGAYAELAAVSLPEAELA